MQLQKDPEKTGRKGQRENAFTHSSADGESAEDMWDSGNPEETPQYPLKTLVWLSTGAIGRETGSHKVLTEAPVSGEHLRHPVGECSVPAIQPFRKNRTDRPDGFEAGRRKGQPLLPSRP
ncbi:uncharacterized protein LOC118645916 [Monomorium pharaonis]|uniref:uncharacterized protein LOC118645916 n=1 Tax=Monomorium pharaonis TaxID=307658 RepID=UPI0017479393|nr:uncharacterized protein LOC118645916 [Monomorium pharaonis]